MMKQSKLKWYILASLFLHLLVLIAFIIYGFSKREKPFILPINKTAQTEPERVTTMLIPFQSPQAQGVPQKTPEPTPAQQPIKQAKEKKTLETPTEEKPRSASFIKKPLDDKALIMQKILAQQQPEPEKHEAPEPKKDIKSLTMGFLKAAKAQGNSLMERKGENRMPSLKELKYLSYQQKIDECLMSSWRIVRFNKSLHMQQAARPVSFTYEINEDGSLVYLKLVASSGDKEFDRLVLESVKNAAPFPPIPKHFGVKRYKPIGGTYRVNW